jgi:hypothetical protein
MDDRDLLRRVLEARQAFGVKCAKFAGAVTVELFRQALVVEGFTLSPRDVFILGVPVEIDLLMLREGAKAGDRIFYEPSDVLAAFEIKNRGSFGARSVESVRRSFKAIQSANTKIVCMYVTLAERRNYKWAVTSQMLGFEAFTLFWHKGSERKLTYESSGDWERLLCELATLCGDESGVRAAGEAGKEEAEGRRG